MASLFDNWKTALDKLKSSIDKDLEEIRRSKLEMQQLKLDIIDHANNGQYIRDDDRIIISAPEIVIGNVNKEGQLIGDSHILLRGTEITQEGIGFHPDQYGRIVNRASLIQNECIDPGIDGRENVVRTVSSFTVHAKGIAMKSEKANGAFTDTVASSSCGEITLSAESSVNVNALLPGNIRSKKIENEIKSVDSAISDFKQRADTQKKAVDTLFSTLDDLLQNNTGLYKTNNNVRTYYRDIESLQDNLNRIGKSLNSALCDCVGTLSSLAELNRQKKSLEAAKNEIDSFKSNYKKQSTGAAINLQAEKTYILSCDGDHNLRENEGSGLDIQACNVHINAAKTDGSLMDKSTFELNTKDIKLTTVNPKCEKDKSDLPTVGNVLVRSKNVIVESVDYESKDKKISEKALTKDGLFSVRAENMQFAGDDTEGKASGRFAVNSKAITMRGVDVDKEKRTFSKLAEGSTMTLVSEKMFAGSIDDKNLSKDIQISTDKLGMFAKTTVEIQQDKGKATVQLSSGNLSMGGSKSELFGETTVNGKTTFKSETQAPKTTVDHIEIKTSLKSPCTTEGVAVPSTPSSATLSTKLKEEAVPKDENKQPNATGSSSASAPAGK